MIKIICIGKIKEKYFIEALEEYQKRLSKYTKLKIIELKDEPDANPVQALKKEKEQILKNINETDNLVLLDPKGKEYTSEELAEFINKELTYQSNITFIIGSSNGIEEIYNILKESKKAKNNNYVREKIRQTLNNNDNFVKLGTIWSLCIES